MPYQYFKHDSGWIIFPFESETDRDQVFHGGPPSSVFGRPQLTKAMPLCFEEVDDLNIVPVLDEASLAPGLLVEVVKLCQGLELLLPLILL